MKNCTAPFSTHIQQMIVEPAQNSMHFTAINSSSSFWFLSGSGPLKFI